MLLILTFVTYLCHVIRPKGRLSKAQVAMLLGCFHSNTAEVNGRELRKGFFTDEVLKKLGLTPDEYNKIKRFNYEQSIKIIEIFHFERDDLVKIEMSA